MSEWVKILIPAATGIAVGTVLEPLNARISKDRQSYAIFEENPRVLGAGSARNCGHYRGTQITFTSSGSNKFWSGRWCDLQLMARCARDGLSHK
jgi:hypothetical protein